MLRELHERGYTTDFFIDEDDGSVRCGSCRTSQRPDQVRLDGLRRLEGASDPADMAAVVALTCSACSRKGTAVVRFGPEATAGEAMLLRLVDDARPTGLDVAEDAAT